MTDIRETDALERKETFRFKRFGICDTHCGMKLCSDSVLLGAWCFGRFGLRTPAPVIYDIGAGSGILSLMCAQRFSEASIVAIEIEYGAICDAKGNFDASPWSNRLEILQGDVTKMDLPAYVADGIVANPPYFTSGELSPESNRAKARHSVSDESQGLTPEALGRIARHLLKQGASLDVVYPFDMAEEVIFQMTLCGLDLRDRLDVSYRRDQGRIRSLLSFVDRAPTSWTQRLSIREHDGSIADEYKNLTKAFYLKF